MSSVQRRVAGDGRRPLGLALWIAPAQLVESIRRAAALTTPRACAAMLARLPAIPTLRAQLRRSGPVADRAQLRLL